MCSAAHDLHIVQVRPHSQSKSMELVHSVIACWGQSLLRRDFRASYLTRSINGDMGWIRSMSFRHSPQPEVRIVRPITNGLVIGGPNHFVISEWLQHISVECLHGCHSMCFDMEE
jgi:hypothetical protein